jgi:hypothetical protein
VEELFDQRGGDFAGHRDAPSGQSQDHDVGTIPVPLQNAGDNSAGISPIAEEAAIPGRCLHQ